MARSLERTRVISPKLAGSVTPRALDSLATCCRGASALVMVGNVTCLPVSSKARPDASFRAWPLSGIVLRTM
jgi:hypothetical protein